METYIGMLCDCCLIAAVNNDTSGHDYYCENDPTPLSALPDGHEVIGDNAPNAYEDEDIEAITHEFYKYGCDGCGMYSAGRRTECVIEIR